MRRLLQTLFGRRAPGTVGAVAAEADADPRWARLERLAWTCAGCGGRHQGRFDLGMPAPVYWQGEAARPNREVGGVDPFLSEDLCVIDGNFFVRAVLPLPLVGGGGRTFGYGVWSSLSAANFERYVGHFDDGEEIAGEAWFGWFASALKGYPDTVNLKCNVLPQDDRRRPELELHESEHPLFLEQRDGVTFERLMEIYALNGCPVPDDA